MDTGSPRINASPRAGGAGNGSGNGGGSGAGSGAVSAESLPFILAHEDELEDDDVPDEDLDVSSGKHQLWLVKVPSYLMNEWNRVKVPDVRIGTVRVYDELDASGKQRMELLLPQDWQAGTGPITSSGPSASPSLSQKRKASEMESKPAVSTIPKAFDLKLAPHDASAANLYAFREQWEMVDDGEPGSSQAGSRAGTPAEVGSSRGRKRPRVTTALIGCVANETHVQAKIDPKGGIAAEVRQQLRKRRAEAEKKRSIQILDADAGTANMLSSGVNVGLLKSRFGKFSIAKAQPSSKGVDKRARMPKNELLDMLWPMFESQAHLRLKTIAERTQQPEAYLRDVLGEVAELHKRGPFSGHYSIKPEFMGAMQAGASSARQAEASGSGSGSGSGTAAASGSGAGGAGADGTGKAPTADEDEDFEEVA